MNAEHREAARVDYWRQVAKELDVEFELLIDGDPKHMMILITGPVTVANVLISRAAGEPCL